MHTLMQRTIVRIALSSLPAVVFFARIDACVEWFVLSEVKRLWRMNLAPNFDTEILVRDDAVAISIQVAKQFVEGFIWNLNAPVTQHESKFAGFDHASFIWVERSKRFAQCFPLELNFRKNFLLQILVVAQLTGNLRDLVIQMVLLNRCVERRVLNRVMSEIKSLRLVDCGPNPLRKVRITESAFFLAVFVR